VIPSAIPASGSMTALSLDAPIEDLKLSKRVRNVLRLSGLHSVGSLLECDYEKALRGFGPRARAELACALQSNGFAPPANLNPSELDVVSEDVSKLLGQMEATLRSWSARLEHFEARIREVTAVCRASGTLQQIAALPPEQQEMVASIEEESRRFNRLAGHLLEMLSRQTACHSGEPLLPR